MGASVGGNQEGCDEHEETRVCICSQFMCLPRQGQPSFLDISIINGHVLDSEWTSVTSLTTLNSDHLPIVIGLLLQPPLRFCTFTKIIWADKDSYIQETEVTFASASRTTSCATRVVIQEDPEYDSQAFYSCWLPQEAITTI